MACSLIDTTGLICWKRELLQRSIDEEVSLFADTSLIDDSRIALRIFLGTANLGSEPKC